MQQFLEFIGNHLLLSGLFVAVLVAWLAWELARLARKWREVSTREAVHLINREDALVLDVSNSTDHAAGHIIGAMHMPPSRIESGNQQLLKQRERPVLVYCKNNQVAPQMANRLVGLGFSNVNVLAGGLTQWISDQQPVSRQKGAAKKKDKSARRKKGETAASD
jgi:rhodanese-related sulfurtransferase